MVRRSAFTGTAQVAGDPDVTGTRHHRLDPDEARAVADVAVSISQLENVGFLLPGTCH